MVCVFFNYPLGNCSKEEFLKAISKIGITGFTDKNLLELFDIYDADASGELDYKEFVGGLFNNVSIAKKGEERKNENKTPSKQSYLNREE